MRARILQTVEITNDERKAIAALLDGSGGKPRMASQNECRDFVWNKGEQWQNWLVDGGPMEPVDLDDDLLGDDDDDWGLE